MVLVQMPSNNPKEWDRVTRTIQTNLMKGGIDPVIYYDINIIFSGVDISRSFILDLTKREIQNIILLQYRGDNSRIAVLDFLPEFFGSESVPAWIRKGDLKTITEQLFVRAANSGLPFSNFLISEVPESGSLTKPIKGRRAQFYSLSMSTGKTAVPKWGDPLKDQEMQALFDRLFDYEFELVDATLTDAELEAMGFSFVLRYGIAPLKELRVLLDYEEEDDVTGFVTIRYDDEKSQAVTLSLSDIAYKYYFNHFKSNTTYLGSEWDADIVWQQSLLNHLKSIEKWVNR